MISRYISTALCAAASVPFRSGGAAASLQGEGLGERIGMEWVLCSSVIIFSFFGKSVLCISLFNCVGFSNVGFSNVADLISKKDYQDLKNTYTERAEQAQEAIDRLRAEMELVANNSSSRLRWTQHFKAFSAMTTLDRRAVVALVQSIRVEGKHELAITFRYHIEFFQVLKRLDQMGKLPPDLREVLNDLMAMDKEAA